ISYLPGVFLQDQWSINDNNKLLIGLRGDYNSIHGSIFSPRINYKWNSDNKLSILRISAGNGYRVANVFTEDHAALTGARKVEFAEKLNPETSYNINVNYIKKFISKKGNFLGLDGSVFYTYFNNKIIPDYTSDPNKIIYANLKDHAVSQGVSLNADISFNNGFKLILGGTYMDVYSVENGQKISQMLTEKFTGNWNITYEIRKIGLAIDYNGKVYGPMRLPILNALDPRSEYSETWSIQNIQITKKFKHNIEVFGGVKNLLNWTPNKNNPFIIARAHDPFDKNVQFDANGNAAVTTENPYGLTFDAAYVYGPNQGIRGFLGLRWSLE
ncbi:MAG: TonB-dependent receptor plug domain-containing protein, partial [Bacteroidia bacterium]